MTVKMESFIIFRMKNVKLDRITNIFLIKYIPYCTEFLLRVYNNKMESMDFHTLSIIIDGISIQLKIAEIPFNLI